MICEFCGVWVYPFWARCYNCGEPIENNCIEDELIEESEIMENLKAFEREELSANKIRQLMKQPIIETKITTSKDGRYVIVKTIITDIKPITYYKKVLGM